MSDKQGPGGERVEGCIFCQISEGRIPSIRIYEDDDFISFMDISPITEGHFLIVPKGHYELLEDVPDAILAKTLPLVKKLSNAAMAGLGVEDFNLIQNNGERAGQVVGHWHMHVIPRRAKSELPQPSGEAADLTKLPFVAEKIRINIG